MPRIGDEKRYPIVFGVAGFNLELEGALLIDDGLHGELHELVERVDLLLDHATFFKVAVDDIPRPFVIPIW